MAVVTWRRDDPLESTLPIDIFVAEPLDFDQEYGLALVVDVSDTVSARIVSLQTLLDLKQKAGRAQDLADIEELRLVRERDADER